MFVARHQTSSLFLLLAVLVLVSCTKEGSDAKKASLEGTAAAGLTSPAEDAYVFGLGPVAMYKWYQKFAVDEGNLNQLGYSTAFAKPGELPGGSPNNDTYYGKGWLDLSVGPYVVSLPDFGERYYVFQLTDIYGFNFLNVGNSLSSGQKDAYRRAYTFALVPPGWKGDVPAGVERVDSPVRLVNVLYRIHVGNEAIGGPEARRLQQETLILPLSDWEAGKRENIQVMPKQPVAPYKDVIAVGKNVVAADQRNLDFFVMLDNLLRFEPPWNEWDRQFVSEQLSALGIGGDKPFDPRALTPDQAKQLMDGQESGFTKVLEKSRNVGVEVNGWQYTDPDAGLYHDDFLLRAAMIYTGGMYPSMQVSRYANLSVGPDGRPLVGSKPMVLTLPGNDMPPATSFWSVTMYSMGSFDLVENPINRYLISSTSTGLHHDQDGSLTIYIQNEKPSEDTVSNWLPAPAGEYFLLFRWYAPTERVINLDYKLPAIEEGSTISNVASAQHKPNLPPPNPFLIPGSIYPMIHWNSAATDVTTASAWTGNHVVKTEQVQWQPLPPSSVGAAHYPYPDGEQAMILSGSNAVSKMRITDGVFELIDRVTIPGYDEQNATEDEIRDLVKALETGGTKEDAYLPPLQAYNSKHQVSGENLAFGVYTLLDRDGNYYAGWGTSIYKVADEKPGDVRSKMKIAKSFNLKDGLKPEQAAKISRLLGLAMTYDGHIAVAMPGIIAVLDRDLNNMQHVMLEGEAIDNGITVDEAGGIYVVTSKYMRKLVWDGSKLSDRESDGAWKSGYDYVPNPRAFSRGAGNTPTLMGFGPEEQHLVIIADAGDPVKIVAFWRDEIPKDFKQHPETRSRRIAGQLPLSIKVPATIEWSPHVYGYGTMMFASAWPDPVKADGKLDLYSTVMSAGVSRRAPRGSEKFIWDPKTYSFKSAWTTDYGMQWALHPISTATHTVHLAELKKGVYSLVAIDWTTGKEVGRTKLGKSPIFNTMGGFFIPLENGDIYVTGVFGPVRISKHVP